MPISDSVLRCTLTVFHLNRWEQALSFLVIYTNANIKSNHVYCNRKNQLKTSADAGSDHSRFNYYISLNPCPVRDQVQVLLCR